MVKITTTEHKALVELSARKNMAIKMFRPLPHQDIVFDNNYSIFLCRGGNRCSASGTEVLLVRSTYRGRPDDVVPIRIDDVNISDVLSGVRVGGVRTDLVPAVVTSKRTFKENAFRITSKRGYILDGTTDHPVWACPPLLRTVNDHESADPDCKKGKWVEMADIQPGWFIRMSFGPYVGWSGEIDENAYVHGLMDGDGSCDCYEYGVMKLTGHQDESLIPWMSEYLNKKGVHNKAYKKGNSLGVSLEWCNKSFKEEYQLWSPEWNAAEIAGYIRGMMDTDGCVSSEGKVILVQKDEERIRKIHRWLLLFGIKSSLYFIPANPEQKRPNPIYRLQISGCSVNRYAESIGFGETEKICKLANVVYKLRTPGSNRLWWDRVRSVDPIGERDIVAISTDNETYISNGIVSHNSGKSTTCAVKFAATAMDSPVVLSDGRVIHQRREHQWGKKLDMWVVGYDWTHIGMTIYRLLFRGGLFKVIFDDELGEYRAFRPNDPKDQGREKSAIDSPPLIPKRYIKPDSWAWENKKLRQFKKVDIWNPETQEALATIYAFPSTAEAKAGDIVDCIWIDEKIENAEHFNEWKARLTDREGHLFWSSWPSIENDALKDITEEAEKQKDYAKPEFGEAILKFSDNTALPQHLVDKRLSQFTSEAEKLARDKGEYVTGLLKMYPDFSEYTHDVFSYDDELARAISKNGDQIPSDWTRELVLDPGRSHPFVLLCAIPPPNLGDFLVPYDEISMEDVDAFRLASVVKDKLRGYAQNRMIIDGHAARQTPMGFGHTVGKQYKQAFEKYQIKLYNGGTYFVEGCDNVSGRISALQVAMSKDNRIPRLRILTKRCPVLVKQLKRYLKRMIKKEVEEFEPMPRQQIDGAVSLEYWISSNPRYAKPKVSAKPVADMDDFEYDEAFFNDDHDRRASGRGGAMIGPQYHIAK